MEELIPYSGHTGQDAASFRLKRTRVVFIARDYGI